MLKDKTKGFPDGSVKDCVRYDGPLKDWIAAEEDFLASVQRDFQLYGFDHESMFVPAIFPMIGAVQTKFIHGPDFFGPSIFVEYDNPEGTEYSHHSGWRLLKDADRPGGIVILSVSNPNTRGIDILIEGEPGEEWIQEVIKTYYTARRTAAVVQSRVRASAQSGCALR
ncbi:MAG TPA: hypothetical protein VLE72_03210 [Candidatus Saccharimonadales bacterium]|nr:hypothetical protein [Candidatus Saccharimonadales bacterium]